MNTVAMASFCTWARVCVCVPWTLLIFRLTLCVCVFNPKPAAATRLFVSRTHHTAKARPIFWRGYETYQHQPPTPLHFSYDSLVIAHSPRSILLLYYCTASKVAKMMKSLFDVQTSQGKVSPAKHGRFSQTYKAAPVQLQSIHKILLERCIL
jgi:hypothetical protein